MLFLYFRSGFIHKGFHENVNIFLTEMLYLLRLCDIIKICKF